MLNDKGLKQQAAASALDAANSLVEWCSSQAHLPISHPCNIVDWQDNQTLNRVRYWSAWIQVIHACGDAANKTV